MTHARHYITTLTIAGSDSGGGAGIQADIKTMSALGCFATSVITAVTAQNTTGVRAIHAIPGDIIRHQIDAVLDDLRPKAIKIGMINTIEAAQAIYEGIRNYDAPVVLDPVMVATSGSQLSGSEVMAYIRKTLFPLAEVITPNLTEAQAITGMEIHTVDDMIAAAAALLPDTRGGVLVKGGHLQGEDMTDVLLTHGGGAPQMFSSSHISSRNLHGTGCTLSSAIASFLAHGRTLAQAVAEAKQYVHDGILHGKDISIGEGHGPLNHFFAPQPLAVTD